MELKGLIVSCQLEGDYYKDVLSRSKVINWMISECLRAGVNQVRLCGAREIELARREFGNDIVIVGCTKTYDKNGRVHITKSMSEICDIMGFCDYVASENWINGNSAERKMLPSYVNIKKLIYEPTEEHMEDGDCDCGFGYWNFSCDGYISTTLLNLSGYKNMELKYRPDYINLKRLASGHSKVIAEGQYWTAEDINLAFELGTKAVCIGAAITKPAKIIERYKSLCGNL